MKLHKNTLTALTVFLVGLKSLIFVTGCVGNDPNSITGSIGGDITFEVATKVGVNELLNGDKVTARNTIEGVDYILSGIESGQFIAPSQVQTAISGFINGLDLSQSSKVTLATVADVVSRQYSLRIDAGQLDSKTLADIKTILTWIRQAAEDSLIYEAPLQYGAPPLDLIGKTRPRSDLFGYILGLEEENPNYDHGNRVDPKWHAGLIYMLENAGEI